MRQLLWLYVRAWLWAQLGGGRNRPGATRGRPPLPVAPPAPRTPPGISLTWQAGYGWWALGLLLVELAIGWQLHDALIRPYGGDFLVVILLYCAGRSVVRAPAWVVALPVLLLAYAIEGAQYAGLLAWLGWQHSVLARLVLGYHFAWADMLAYSLGIGGVLAVERWRQPRPQPAR